MSKVKQALENCTQLITRHPNGVSIEELLHLIPATPKRTLQYRLASLIKRGLIRREGKGKSCRYYPSFVFYPTIQSSPLILSESTRSFSVIPFSKEAQEIKESISLPIQRRQRVGYKREFLEAYEPNKTFYLTGEILEKLTKLGSGVERGRPAGTYARKIYERLLIDLSWNSSRLEGNTYSLLDTEKLLVTGEGMPGKNREETQMILNHKDAIEFLVEMAEDIDINRYTILNIHSFLAHGLLFDPRTCGRLRVVPVGIGKSVYRPLEHPHLIEENFQILLQKAAAIHNPFEQSFFLMVHLPYLQPFLDVNKRVSRLAGNIPFIRKNLCPLSFVDVPTIDYIHGLLAIYELNRIELFRDLFVWAYERSASLYIAALEEVGEPDPFRVRYRSQIRQAVHELIIKKMSPLEASRYVSLFANEQLPLEDRHRFIQIIEIEMSSLHEGNFARFKIRLSEFLEWQKMAHMTFR